jgi:hypothetical protein
LFGVGFFSGGKDVGDDGTTAYHQIIWCVLNWGHLEGLMITRQPMTMKPLDLSTINNEQTPVDGSLLPVQDPDEAPC